MNLDQITLKNAWEVLALFLIPIGGGIPGAVLLAKAKGFNWQTMEVLYFISDIILACVFEPLIMLFTHAGKRSEKMAKFNQSVKASVDKTIANYGVHLGPFALILVSFGVDPMTGRTAAFAAGHRFFSGWGLAIIGDMFYFTLLMASTLWLNGILGDGTWTTIIILAVMMGIPYLIRRYRESRQAKTQTKT